MFEYMDSQTEKNTSNLAASELTASLWMPQRDSLKDTVQAPKDRNDQIGEVREVKITDNGSTISVNQSSMIRVVLDGNPSTGYLWRVTGSGGDSVQQVGKVVIEPKDPRKPGSPATFIAQFWATKPGDSSIELTYSRGKDQPAAGTFKLNIEVKKRD